MFIVDNVSILDRDKEMSSPSLSNDLSQNGRTCLEIQECSMKFYEVR